MTKFVIREKSFLYSPLLFTWILSMIFFSWDKVIIITYCLHWIRMTILECLFNKLFFIFINCRTQLTLIIIFKHLSEVVQYRPRDWQYSSIYLAFAHSFLSVIEIKQHLLALCVPQSVIWIIYYIFAIWLNLEYYCRKDFVPTKSSSVRARHFQESDILHEDEFDDGGRIIF